MRNIDHTLMIETPTLLLPLSGIRRLKEPFCALSHYAGTAFGFAATTLLLFRAWGHFWSALGCAIYGVSLTLMYLASALSHTWHAAPRVQTRFSQFDYIAIALLIAGTYAPLCLVTLHGMLGWTVLAVEYALASVVIANVVFRDRTPHWTRVILYVLMGWAVALVWGPVTHALPHGAVVWMVAGGILYSVGVAVLGSDRPHLWPGRFSAHDLWHIFVIAGSTCHFWLIWRYVA